MNGHLFSFANGCCELMLSMTVEFLIVFFNYFSARTQIIGMSATLNNIKDLKHFLSAEVFSNDFRPVQLTEYVKMDDVIYDVNSSALCPEDCLRMNRMISCKVVYILHCHIILLFPI